MKSEKDIYKFLCFVITHFGAGGHPEPTVATLHLFGEKYVGECIKKAIASGKISSAAAKMGTEYLKLTGA